MSFDINEDERSRLSRSSTRSGFSSDDDDFDDDESDLFIPPEVEITEDANDTHHFASKETRLVQFSRCFIIFMLIGSAGVACYLTFTYLKTGEDETFQTQFDDDANEVIVKANQRIITNLKSIMFLSTALTSSSANRNNNANKLPFFTLNDFEVIGQQYAQLSGSVFVGLSPLITENSRSRWEEYSVEEQGWIQKGLEIMESNETVPKKSITPYIYRVGNDGNKKFREPEIDGMGLYSPIWQTSPTPQKYRNYVNFNLLNFTPFQRLVNIINATKTAAVSEVFITDELFFYESQSSHTNNEPMSMMVAPVFDDVTLEVNTSKTVAHIISIIPWTQYFDDILKDKHVGIISVLADSCNRKLYTFRIDGPKATYLGARDLHDEKYNGMARSKAIVLAPDHDEMEDEFRNHLAQATSHDLCTYNLTVYPSQAIEDSNTSNRPLHYTLGVLVIFLFTSLMFLLYDAVVQYRQSKLMALATKTSSIVTSLFPAQVRDQLFGRLTSVYHPQPPPSSEFSFRSGDNVDENKKSLNKDKKKNKKNKKGKKKELTHNFGVGNYDGDIDPDSKPIADLFPSATVLFGDIAGFTAWSSVREPSQVFILLETIYRAFDKIAKQRRVFKVETIGDCYVAVVGLPDPCKDHAIVMAKFARDVMAKLNELTHKLELTLGPDTGDLAMRIGLHSGPVTAGVLRGERARFQLFGDTVNTASRMESTGVKSKIQVSQETADLIIAGGKANWVELREDLVEAKGKGLLQTYWLKPKRDILSGTMSSSQSCSENDEDLENSFCQDFDTELGDQEMATPCKKHKMQRMIDWNTDVLLKLLHRVIATRAISGIEQTSSDDRLLELESSTAQVGSCMKDVVEVISLPRYDSAAYKIQSEHTGVDEEVVRQLKTFVTLIASMYKQNPFHNFEHASHVTMSTVKLLSRIIVPTSEMKGDDDEKICTKDLHYYTYGITSDPLTQFAVVFSALIHDVDHKGIPNFLLCKEDTNLASVYNQQSVAEQNSVDISWGLLMYDCFKDLRRAIYATEDEMKRFRCLVVNSVIATDIFDKDLSLLRKERWTKAFSGDYSFSDTSRCRKATIVIEHLIQASDVSHTMQHWHVYQKWNERLYREMYNAYTSGRSDKDPTDGWYQGELNFFDGYIIPLAKKLKECNVFGVSSDEYLNYAENNRSEWENKGQEIVARMHKKCSGNINADMLELEKLEKLLESKQKVAGK